MRGALLLSAAAVPIALTQPASAQSMQGMNMPGMTMPMPAKKAPAKKASAKTPAAKNASAGKSATKPAQVPRSKSAAPPMGAMPGMDMSGGNTGQDMAAMPGMAMEGMAQTGTALPAGDAPAPAPPTDHYADRFFPPAEIHRAHEAMMREDGGQNFSLIFFNLAEYQARKGGDGYRWDGEGWFGGDINRLTIKTEGEGAFRGGVDTAEVQALYSRAVGPYFNFQAGFRHDFQPSPTRTYATVGFEGLAPYMFEVEGALFLSDKGDLLGRLEGYYDQRITQRLILQPRIELNLAAQDVPRDRVGSGLTNAELGLRLRYEIRREFAPYVGVSWDRKVGDTARFARAAGDRVQATSLVLGIRTWF